MVDEGDTGAGTGDATEGVSPAAAGDAASGAVVVGPASFRVLDDAGAVVVHVGGELDAQSGSHLRMLLTKAYEGSPTAVVVDLSELEFVDSVGLSVLVAGHNRGRSEDVPFSITNVPASCMRVFEITRLVEVFGLR